MPYSSLFFLSVPLNFSDLGQLGALYPLHHPWNTGHYDNCPMTFHCFRMFP